MSCFKLLFFPLKRFFPCRWVGHLSSKYIFIWPQLSLYLYFYAIKFYFSVYYNFHAKKDLSECYYNRLALVCNTCLALTNKLSTCNFKVLKLNGFSIENVLENLKASYFSHSGSDRNAFFIVYGILRASR